MVEGARTADQAVTKPVQDEDNMRRANKGPSSKRTTHLDLPSNEDGDVGNGSSKVHKRKGSRSKSTIAVACLCGLVALGTLFYVSNTVFSSEGKVAAILGKKAVSGSAEPVHNKERFMEQQNRLLPPDSIYRTKVQDIHDDWQQLMKYSGSVSLIVNVACE